MEAPSPDHSPSLVNAAICKLMIKMRRIEAITPTTRNGSAASRMCERMAIRTVCRISTSINTTNNWSRTRSVSVAMVQLARPSPKQSESAGNCCESGDRKEYGQGVVDSYFDDAKVITQQARRVLLRPSTGMVTDGGQRHPPLVSGWRQTTGKCRGRAALLRDSGDPTCYEESYLAARARMGPSTARKST